MQQWIIVTKLSDTFNAESADVKAVLTKYNVDLHNTRIGRGPQIDIAEGVQPKDEEAFIKEFGALPGVESVHKEPFPCRR